MHYLDYNATAPLLPEVKAAMLEVIGQPLNPSSIHASGRAARKLVESARANILNAVGAKGQGLIFASCATEANNIALNQNSQLVISEIEHESIYKSKSQKVKVAANGVIDLNHLEEVLKATPNALISVMLANNETGIVQPIRQIVDIAKAYGAQVHTDAVQVYGRINIDFEELGVDFMTISGHKAGAAVGVAALIHKKEIELKPIMFGGGQEKNKRPGTENIIAIHGLGSHAAKFVANVPRETCLNKFNEHIESEISKLCPGAIVGQDMLRLPNTSVIIMPGKEAATQLIAFDMAGIFVSSGSACSSGKVEVSRTLKAMGLENARNAIRVSTGWATTQADAEAFVAKWKELFTA